MKKFNSIAFALVLTLSTFNLMAQTNDSTNYVNTDTNNVVEEIMDASMDNTEEVENVTVEEMVFEINPVKKIVDEFIPDTLGEFINHRYIRNTIDSDLRGCSKSYIKNGNYKESINVIVSRNKNYKISVRDSLPKGITEKSISIKGYKAIYTENKKIKSVSLKVVVSDKIIIFSSRGILSEKDLLSFAKQLNYSIIARL